MTTQSTVESDGVATATTAATDHASENESARELLQLVTFVVGGEEYAVPILSVHEINRMLEFTRVPQAPDFVEGVINLRGRIIPVVDLRLRFGLPEQEKNSDNRIVVVEVSGRVIGFTVDRVNEVLRISPDIVDSAPSLARTGEAEYVSGVGKLEDRLLIMLDLDMLFGEEELDALDETTHAA